MMLCVAMSSDVVSSNAMSSYVIVLLPSFFFSILLSLFPTLTLPSLSPSLLYYYHLRLRLTSALYPAYSTLLLLLLSTLLPVQLPVQLPSAPYPLLYPHFHSAIIITPNINTINGAITNQPITTSPISFRHSSSIHFTIYPPTICALSPAHRPLPQIRTAPART
jgi:hypothetical protein